MRFWIGTWYSSEFSTDSISYVVAPCTFAVPIPGLSGTQTLYMQLSNEDGGIYSGGKVDPGKIVVEILNP